MFDVTEVAAGVKYELDLNADGWGKENALRLMFHSLQRLKFVTPEKLEIALQEPGTIGDTRWDTLFAAAIKYQLRKYGMPIPDLDWLDKPPLEVLWFPMAQTPKRATYVFNTAPPELRQVGIFISEASFR
jgi:hypothetical protein